MAMKMLKRICLLLGLVAIHNASATLNPPLFSGKCKNNGYYSFLMVVVQGDAGSITVRGVDVVGRTIIEDEVHYRYSAFDSRYGHWQTQQILAGGATTPPSTLEVIKNNNAPNTMRPFNVRPGETADDVGTSDADDVLRHFPNAVWWGGQWSFTYIDMHISILSRTNVSPSFRLGPNGIHSWPFVMEPTIRGYPL